MDDAIDRGEPLSPVAMNLKSELDSEAGALSCVGTAALCAEETNERSIPDFSAAVGGGVLPLLVASSHTSHWLGKAWSWLNSFIPIHSISYSWKTGQNSSRNSIRLVMVDCMHDSTYV